MRKAIFIAAILFSLAANSQNKFGIRAGAATTDRTGSYNSAGQKSLFTFQAAAFELIHLKKLFILQPSIGYTPKGYRFTHVTFEDQFGTTIGQGDLNFRFDYIELTFPVQYLLSDQAVKIAAGAGPYISYAIDGKISRKNIVGPAGNEPRKRDFDFDANQTRKVDGGLNVLVSAFIKSRYMLSFNCDLGMVNISTGDRPKSHTVSAGLTVGYLFK